MRLARLRRALGPVEPVLVGWVRHLQARSASRRRTAVVVVATDAPHLDRVEPLAAGLGDATGFWFTAVDDVAPLARAGWFVVRLEPASWTDATVRARVAAVAAALVLREVIDLRSGPTPVP